MTIDRGLKIAEAATILGVHPETVRREINRGNIPAFRVGRVWRIRASEVEKLMRRKH